MIKIGQRVKIVSTSTMSKSYGDNFIGKYGTVFCCPGNRKWIFVILDITRKNQKYKSGGFLFSDVEIVDNKISLKDDYDLLLPDIKIQQENECRAQGDSENDIANKIIEYMNSISFEKQSEYWNEKFSKI